MSTVIRPVVTKKNEYYIPKERYYELKHFCLQYLDWQLYCNSLIGSSRRYNDGIRSSDPSDPVFEAVRKRERYLNYINMVENAAEQTDPVLGHYILKGVIHGYTYEMVNAREQVPCCRVTYYELYRKYFWILSRLRDE